MFGQNNNDQNQQSSSAGTDDQNPMLANSTPPNGFFNPSASQAPAPGQDVLPPSDQPTDQGAPMIMDDNPTSFVAPATPADAADEATAAPAPASTPTNSDDLLGMKQEALQQLQPLVNHLDQSPEEKFRTIMMMIQASDDHTKLNEAFEAAKQITDDKVRAQALLDVINEINYFTQHQN
jgi:hypothetical protein